MSQDQFVVKTCRAAHLEVAIAPNTCTSVHLPEEQFAVKTCRTAFLVKTCRSAYVG